MPLGGDGETVLGTASCRPNAPAVFSTILKASVNCADEKLLYRRGLLISRNRMSKEQFCLLLCFTVSEGM